MLRKTPIKPKRETLRRKGKPTPRIKPERVEDRPYLDMICKYGCWACHIDGFGYQSAEPHHPRNGGLEGPGAGQKASDHDAIPLCRIHHNERHPYTYSIHANPIEFRARYGNESDIKDWVLNWLKKEGYLTEIP